MPGCHHDDDDEEDDDDEDDDDDEEEEDGVEDIDLSHGIKQIQAILLIEMLMMVDEMI